jgi:DNA-binding transcriptional MerR regulator
MLLRAPESALDAPSMPYCLPTMVTGDRSKPSVRSRPVDDAVLTIDDLASAAGMTARNVRAHQSRGLLPPPAIKGRVALYGPTHLARLQLIRALQDDGFNLATIVSLFAAGKHDVERMRRLSPSQLELMRIDLEAEIGTNGLAALAAAPGGDIDTLVEHGLLRPLGDGRYAAASPALLAAGRRLNQLGIGAGEQANIVLDVARFAQSGGEDIGRLAAGICGDRSAKAITEAVRAYVAEIYMSVFSHTLAKELAADAEPAQ